MVAKHDPVAWWAILLLVVAAVAALFVVALALFVLATWRQRVAFDREKGEQVAVGAWAALALFRNELGALLTLMWWRLTGFGDGGFSPSQTKNRGRPVVCVHGLWGDPSNMRGIRRALDARGRPSYAVDLGRPFRPIDAYAPPLALALHQAVALHPEGDGFDVVCHSMGGLVLRAVLAADPDLAAQVRTVVFIGSPHQGTAAARGITFLPEGPALAQGSAWLAQLPPLSTSCPQARVVSIVAKGDAIVYPVETCTPEGCEVHVLEHLGHNAPLTRPEAIDVVIAALEGRPVDAHAAGR